MKNNENQLFGQNHEAFAISNEQDICFTVTPNRYEKSSDKHITLGYLIVDK